MAGRRDIGCRAAPKGWLTDDTKTWHVTENEALAGAGGIGFISELRVGVSCRGKRLDRCTTVQCRTMVCPVAVGTPMRRSKERKGGMCRCFSFRKAARLADETEISKLLKDLAGNPERLTKKEEMREARKVSQTKAGTTGPIKPERRGR